MGLKDISIENFRYDLPPERIAVHPVENRDGSRLLVFRNHAITSANFFDLPDFLPQGSRVIWNDTRVIPARMEFVKSTGARIEIFLLEPAAPADYTGIFTQQESCVWSVTIGNLKKWKSGDLLKTAVTGNETISLTASLVTTGEDLKVQFGWEPGNLTFAEILQLFGKTPIPPYLRRDSEEEDRERYQTVYAHFDGSVAAPTAGLHFTDEVIERLRNKSIDFQSVTLHVGSGTFVPVKAEKIGDHPMHTETVLIRRQLIVSLKNSDLSDITLVGTTTLRSLESLYWLGCKILQHPDPDPGNLIVEQWDPYEMEDGTSLVISLDAILAYMDRNEMDTIRFNTRLMIIPGYRIRTTRRLITNFHQPSSTLLLLVAALVGERCKEIYQYALDNGFRFLSYGDSSLLDMNPIVTNG